MLSLEGFLLLLKIPRCERFSKSFIICYKNLFLANFRTIFLAFNFRQRNCLKHIFISHFEISRPWQFWEMKNNYLKSANSSISTNHFNLPSSALECRLRNGNLSTTTRGHSINEEEVKIDNERKLEVERKNVCKKSHLWWKKRTFLKMLFDIFSYCEC